MGCCKSKSEDDDSPETLGFQMKNIFYDADGNLRCGNVTNDKDEEMRQVSLNDAFSTKLKDEDGSEWCVVDTNWFNAWMSFVHLDRNSSPNPGPCRNDRLVTFDEHTQRWVPRSGLVATDKRTNGNYSLMSPAVWEVFRDCYPGSGPEIKYTYNSLHHHQPQHVQFATSSDDHNESPLHLDDEDYPPSHWVIDQAGCDPVEERRREAAGQSSVEAATVGSPNGKAGSSVAGSPRRRSVRHELSDVRLELRGEGSSEDGEESKEEPVERRKKKKAAGYEAMVDGKITSRDRNNILSFFGSQGEDMDFHISKDEAIADKYSKGLGEASTQGGGEGGIEPSEWLFGQQDGML